MIKGSNIPRSGHEIVEQPSSPFPQRKKVILTHADGQQPIFLACKIAEEAQVRVRALHECASLECNLSVDFHVRVALLMQRSLPVRLCPRPVPLYSRRATVLNGEELAISDEAEARMSSDCLLIYTSDGNWQRRLNYSALHKYVGT